MNDLQHFIISRTRDQALGYLINKYGAADLMTLRNRWYIHLFVPVDSIQVDISGELRET